MGAIETKAIIEQIINAHGSKNLWNSLYGLVGKWAHAAHFGDEYRDFSGLKIPTHRRVRPLFFNRVLCCPTLVALDIHDVQ